VRRRRRWRGPRHDHDDGAPAVRDGADGGLVEHHVRSTPVVTRLQADGEAGPLEHGGGLLERAPAHVRDLHLARRDDDGHLAPGGHLAARCGGHLQDRARRGVAVLRHHLAERQPPLGEQRCGVVPRQADEFRWHERHLHAAGQDQLHLTAGAQQQVRLRALRQDGPEGLVAELLADVADRQAGRPQLRQGLLLGQAAQGRRRTFPGPSSTVVRTRSAVATHKPASSKAKAV
jgi:hypothetical protein